MIARDALTSLPPLPALLLPFCLPLFSLMRIR